MFAGALYLACFFVVIPINTEARDYLVHAGDMTADTFWSALAYPAGANTRAVSMLAFGLIHSACGLEAPCVNAIQIAELLAALAVGMVHLRQLIPRPGVIAVAMLVWCASMPVFDAGFWQATQHDKLAFIFSIAALALGLHAIRATRRGRSAVTIVALTVLFVLALNSKEIAFFLPLAAVAQIALFAPEGAGGRRRAAAVYGLPIAYATAYIAIYMWHLQGAWHVHVLSGNAWSNAGFYLGALFWTHTFYKPGLLPILALLLAIVPLSQRRNDDAVRGTDDVDLRIGRVSLYLLSILLATTALVIRAQSPGDYYMLLGAWAFTGWIGAMAAASLRCGPPIKYAVLACIALLVLMFARGRAADALAPDGSWRLVQEARHLDAGYRVLKRACTPRLTDGMKLVFPASPAGKWFFFRGGDEAPDQLVGAFICKDGQTPRMAYSFTGAAQPDRPGQLVAVWSRKLKLAKVSRSGAILYPSSASPGAQ
jgi:hypothetical protein